MCLLMSTVPCHTEFDSISPGQTPDAPVIRSGVLPAVRRKAPGGVLAGRFLSQAQDRLFVFGLRMTLIIVTPGSTIQHNGRRGRLVSTRERMPGSLPLWFRWNTSVRRPGHICPS